MRDDAKAEAALPPGWAWAKLGEVALLIAGQSPPSETYNNKAVGLPFFQGKAEFGDLYPTVRKWCMTPSKIAEQGDILISVRAPVGPTNLALERSGIGRGLAAIRARNGVSSGWLLHWLRFTEQQIAAKGTGTTFAAITAPILAAETLPIAPTAEQRRVVAQIDELFGEIEAGEQELEKAREGLAAYRRAILKAAVTGELTRDWRGQNTPNETGADLLARILRQRRSTWQGNRRYADPVQADGAELALLPQGWIWATLDQLICDGPTNGYSPPSSGASVGTKSLKLTATTSGHMRLDNVSIKQIDETIPADSRYWLRPGDLLLQRANSLDYVGISAIFDGPPDEFIYPDLMMRVRLIEPRMVRWVWRVLNAPMIREWVKARATGTAGSMPKIKGETVRSIPIPLPPPSEMRQALEMIDMLLAISAETECAVNAAEAQATRLRQSILSTAFSGKLVPQDPADEPASVLLERLREQRASIPAARRGRGTASARMKREEARLHHD